MHKWTKDEWVDRFLNQLGRLMPTMSYEDAAHHAASTYVDAEDLSPDEAAEIFALEIPPGEVGAPGSRAWPNTRVRAIEWAQAFADRCHELSGGLMDFDHTLDWAYDLYEKNPTLSPAAVAEEQWAAGASERAAAGL